MVKKSSGVPRDVNQNAARIVALSTGQDTPKNVQPSVEEKRRRSEAASILGKLGGSKGGKARAEKLTPEQRKNIASNAAKQRWIKQKRSPEAESA
jgi:hypothetical protein